jgi:hypothetical protein
VSEHVDRLRRLYPMVTDSFFDLLEEKHPLSRELSDLRGQIAYLIGRYGYHAAQDGNRELATLVGELRLTIGHGSAPLNNAAAVQS